jgi:hypothetical protein
MRATAGGTDFSSFSALTSTIILAVYAVVSMAGGAALMLRRDA